MTEPLVILGPSGVGKSTLGRDLRTRYEVQVIDSDDAFEGTLSTDIFTTFVKLGATRFRQAYAEYIQANADLLFRDAAVTVLGGTAPLSDAVRSVLHSRPCRKVALLATPETIVRRIGGRPSAETHWSHAAHPLLFHPDPADVVRTIFAFRIPYYVRDALEIWTDELSIEEISDRTVRFWRGDDVGQAL